MTNSALLELFDREQRIQIEYPGVRKDVIGSIVRFTRPAPGMNMISYSRLDPATADAEIAAQVAYLSAIDQPFEWMVMDHDQPPDLKERLAAQGFTIEEPSPILVLDLEQVPQALANTPTADVRQVTTREGLEVVIAVMEQVYGGSFAWMRQRMGDHLEIPGYMSVYVAYAEGEPACAAWIYFYPHSHFAGLWGGSTLPAYRKRGLYTALLARRAQEAIARGYRYLYLDASDMSRPIVMKHGFTLLDMETSCEWRGEKA